MSTVLLLVLHTQRASAEHIILQLNCILISLQSLWLLVVCVGYTRESQVSFRIRSLETLQPYLRYSGNPCHFFPSTSKSNINVCPPPLIASQQEGCLKSGATLLISQHHLQCNFLDLYRTCLLKKKYYFGHGQFEQEVRG